MLITIMLMAMIKSIAYVLISMILLMIMMIFDAIFDDSAKKPNSEIKMAQPRAIKHEIQ